MSIIVNGNGTKPRFMNDKTSTLYHALIDQFRTGKLKDVPPYKSDSRVRDKWLQQWRLKETLMTGVLNSVVNIDANRGWSITGGRNLINKWSNRIKDDSANGRGWRHFAKKASLGFWSTDLGNVTGTRRDEPFAIATEQNGQLVINKTQLVSLENIDPAQCYLKNREVDLSEDVEGFTFPIHSRLTYKTTPLMEWDYFRVASMIQDSESFNDLGFCALSRAVEFTRIMFAIWMHDLEKIDSKMPKGLLLLQGIDEDQWRTIMQGRQEELTELERDYYGGLQVLPGIIAPNAPNADAKIIALSQLPTGFNLESQVEIMMKGYALCFGYDVAEFWPVAQGSFGTSEQSKIQAEKTTAKGQNDWSLSFQENLQRELPATVHFEFQERNIAGEKQEAELKKLNAEVLEKLGGIRESTAPLFTNEQLMEVAVKSNLADPDWTITEEPITETDEGNLRERLLEYPKIRAACEMYYNEPIIQYQWRSGKPDKLIELWPTGYDAIKRQLWQVNRALYQDDNLIITEKDVMQAIKI